MHIGEHCNNRKNGNSQYLNNVQWNTLLHLHTDMYETTSNTIRNEFMKVLAVNECSILFHAQCGKNVCLQSFISVIIRHLIFANINIRTPGMCSLNLRINIHDLFSSLKLLVKMNSHSSPCVPWHA
jgi:hypothetical protein